MYVCEHVQTLHYQVNRFRGATLTECKKSTSLLLERGEEKKAWPV